MKYFFIFLTLASITDTNAQDVIMLIKGGNIQAKVQEVKSKECAFDKFDKP